ncbi:MAG TPA: hypothetical protein VL282_13280 [Tepidisphaeraceae bacterium]|jgi:hypothetical protein|nr:hypothetical protein [Tepidisphaeraceae bacterium]
MSREQLEFDDPALRQALKRAFGADMAPLPLVSRIQNALAAEIEPVASRPARPRPRIWSLAAAACLCLFSLSLLASQLWATFAPPRELMAVQSLDIPTELAQAMVARHDVCADQPDHHFLPGVDKNDLTAIRKSLSKALDQKVLVTTLPDGWVFRGASLCPVAGERSAHLLFTRGNQTLSLFSLPNADYPVSNSDIPYEGVQANHPIAGFTHGNGMYCLVGSSPDGKLTLDELKSLRDQLEDTALFVLGPNQSKPTMSVALR